MKKPNIKQAPIKRPDLLLAIEEEEEVRTDRTNFPDAVKAEIYARDRAICAFTGLNLWLLDEGAGGFYNNCWIDHIVPATRGGKSEVDNGVATHWAYNYNKGNTIGESLYLFINGFPTYRFWEYHRLMPPEMAQMIVNNSKIQPSDYHFNQAIINLIGGVCWLHRGPNPKYKRDDEYRASATMRRLDKWKRAVDAEEAVSMEERNLVLDPLTPDQKLLLSLREVKTTEQIKALMKEILPYHSANLTLRLEFETACEKWTEDCDYTDPFSKAEEMLDQPFVSEIVANQIGHNMNMMLNPFAPWNDPEAFAKYIEDQTEGGEVN